MSEGPTSTTRGIGRRRIGNLLNSGGRMAVVGMLASAATIAFTLFLQYLMVRQRDVGEPLVRASLMLELELERTFVKLRGWTAYGDESSKQTRRQIWDEGVAANLVRIEDAARTLRAESVIRDVEAIQDKLRRLRYLQWSVEDIARSDDNQPARALHSTTLRPIGRQIETYLSAAADSVGAEEPISADDARRLMIAYLATDRAILELLDAGTADLAADVRRRAAGLEALSVEVDERWSEPRRSLELSALLNAATEAQAYARRVPAVVDLRTRSDWNVSETLYRTEISSLHDEIEALTRKVSEEQFVFVRRQAARLMRWSFVVLALALLLGALSVASLYLNYRLEFRLQAALAKASNVGRYVIEEHIGGGGMGEVYRARHALLRRPSAVKVLRLDRAFDTDAQERFQNEVRLTSQLTHPNTIAIFDYGRTPEGLFYYAMELLDGIGLDTMVSVSGPQPPARVVHILRQVASSLREAHDRGLLHRDIKPSNVMIAMVGGVPDWVKVLDFGLAVRVGGGSGGSRKGVVVGTPAYLPPEMIATPDDVGPRADLYGIGAVGYFLLTGTPVFERDNVTDLLEAQLHEPPEGLSSRLGAELPKDLELVILACLAKDPTDRPRSAGELIRMLERLSVPEWTVSEAEAWWDEYGEAARAMAREPASADRTSKLQAEGLRSALEVAQRSDG